MVVFRFRYLDDRGERRHLHGPPQEGQETVQVKSYSLVSEQIIINNGESEPLKKGLPFGGVAFLGQI